MVGTNGLYTLNFTHIPMKVEGETPKEKEPVEEKKDAKTDSKEESETTASKNAGEGEEGGPQEEAAAKKEDDIPDFSMPNRTKEPQFSDWSLLVRTTLLKGDGPGSIQGSVKVRAPPGNLDANSGCRTTLLASDCLYSDAASDGSYYFDGTSHFNVGDMIKMVLAFSVNRLDGAVVGLPGELHNVTITCKGHEIPPTVVGDATVTLSNGTQLKLAKPWRFVLRVYNGTRCTKCFDPVETIGYNCQCGAVDYCSRQCQDAHITGHASLCQSLKDFSTPKAAKTVGTFAGVEYPIYWRCIEGTVFKVLVDYNNPLGRPYEMTLDVMKDAKEGINITFLAPESAPISDAELNALNVTVFEQLHRSGCSNACEPLVVIALNHLFVFVDNAQYLLPFFISFVSENLKVGEGVRQVNSLTEYVILTRPLYEGARVAIEGALRSNIALNYHNYLSFAKTTLSALHSLNFDISFPSSLSALQSRVVAAQQRETLKLLAKVLILFAVRAPQEESHHFLRRAEECYKDSIDEDKNRNDLMNMGKTCLSLATLYLLFQTPAETIKAKIVKDQGIELIAIAKKAEKGRQQKLQAQQAQAIAATPKQESAE